FRLDLGVAETQRNAGHRKILTAIRPKQSVDLSVIAGYAKLPLGLAVPGFEFIVVDRPITAHAEVRLEFEVVWEKAWGVAAPRPGASAHHAVVSSFKGVVGAIGVVVVRPAIAGCEIRLLIF